MKNLEAVVLVADVASQFLKAMETPVPDSELDQILRAPLFTMSAIPQLEGIGELLAKAWLEARPASVAARRLAVEHLVDVGKAAEADRIDKGEEPARVGEYSPEELKRQTENEERSLEELGLK